MSHELSIRSNGFVEHAHVGEKGWHGLGNQLEAGASIEDWRAAAGMDWSVRRSRVRFGEGAGQQTWDDNHVLFRSDTKAPLGIVSKGYKTVQPKEVLEFFRDLVADAGFQLDTAGCLFGGRKFWALAKVDDATIAGWDKVGGYILLSSSADGSSSTDCRETTVRVVCQNTLSAALGEHGTKRAKVSHRSIFDATAVKAQMGLSRENFTAFIEAANALSQIRVSRLAAQNFVECLLRGVDKDGKLKTERAAVGEARVLELFQGAGKGAILPGSQGTAWGLVNAVTEYVDHESRAKSADHRFQNAMFGKGDELKTDAFRKAFALLA